MPQRKIISIASHWDAIRQYTVIVGLCDDGSVWRMIMSDDGTDVSWARVKDIPQS